VKLRVLGWRVRKVLILIAGLFVAGCTDADWAHVTSYDNPSNSYPPDSPGPAPVDAGIPVRPAAAIKSSPTANCLDVARKRSHDASDQGFDDDVRQDVYDKTYANCMAWAARTGGN
jgi:hypothetical protein